MMYFNYFLIFYVVCYILCQGVFQFMFHDVLIFFSYFMMFYIRLIWCENHILFYMKKECISCFLRVYAYISLYFYLRQDSVVSLIISLYIYLFNLVWYIPS